MKYILMISVVWFVLLTVAACQPVIAPPATCVIDFEATVHSGPSAGLSLQGPLSINLDTVGDDGRRIRPGSAHIF